jgi:hypothetical protein
MSTAGFHLKLGKPGRRQELEVDDKTNLLQQNPDNVVSEVAGTVPADVQHIIFSAAATASATPQVHVIYTVPAGATHRAQLLDFMFVSKSAAGAACTGALRRQTLSGDTPTASALVQASATVSAANKGLAMAVSGLIDTAAVLSAGQRFVYVNRTSQKHPPVYGFVKVARIN